MDEGDERWKVKEGNMIEKDIKNYLETLGASLRKKEKLLVSLIAFTKEQEEILKHEEFDTDAFEAILEKKSSIIEEINFLDDGFESIFAAVKDKVIESPKKYEEILLPMQEMIKRLTERGVELEASERRNQLKLDYVLARDKSKIKQFNVNNGAVAKYYSNMMKGSEGSNLFLDKKK